MTPMKVTWRGKELEDCTREELIEAMTGIMEYRYESANYLSDEKIKDLEAELRIKNDIIDRLVKR